MEFYINVVVFVVNGDFLFSLKFWGFIVGIEK